MRTVINPLKTTVKPELPVDLLSVGEIKLLWLMVAMFVTFSLLPSDFSWSYSDSGNAALEGSLSMKLEWGSIFLLAGIILLRHASVALNDLFVVNFFLLMMILWCGLSIFWSPFPDVTVKRFVELVGVLMMAIVLQWAPNPFSMLVKSLLMCLTGIMIASFIVVLVNPGMGIDTELGNAWRGVILQKNEAGQIAALAVLLWQVRAYIERVPRTTLMIGLLFSGFMLVMAKSSSSILISALTTVIFHLFRRKYIESTYPVIRIFLMTLVVILVALEIFHTFNGRLPNWEEISSPIAALFGKGSDLTGRTQIWELVEMEIAKHPITGLGYGAFWLGPGSLSDPIIQVLFWIPLQSHDGYLDIINEQGFIGLTLLLLSFILQFITLIRLARTDRLQAAFLTAVFISIIGSNFTESGLFRGVNFQQIFYFITIVAASSSLRRTQQLRQQTDSVHTARKNGRIPAIAHATATIATTIATAATTKIHSGTTRPRHVRIPVTYKNPEQLYTPVPDHADSRVNEDADTLINRLFAKLFGNSPTIT